MLKRVCFCFSRNQSIFFDPYSMNTLYSFVRVCNNSRASNAYIQKYAGFHFLFAPSRPVARPKAGVFSLVLNIEKEKEKEGKKRKNIKAQISYTLTPGRKPNPESRIDGMSPPKIARRAPRLKPESGTLPEDRKYAPT